MDLLNLIVAFVSLVSVLLIFKNQTVYALKELELDLMTNTDCQKIVYDIDKGKFDSQTNFLCSSDDDIKIPDIEYEKNLDQLLGYMELALEMESRLRFFSHEGGLIKV